MSSSTYVIQARGIFIRRITSITISTPGPFKDVFVVTLEDYTTKINHKKTGTYIQLSDNYVTGSKSVCTKDEDVESWWL